MAQARKREFVKHRASGFSGEISVLEGRGKDSPGVPTLTVIIPTLDGFRGGYLPALMAQMERQEFQDFEAVIVKGDTRQGRAINAAAEMARGRLLLTLDDDTSLSTNNLFGELVRVMDQNPGVGALGVANLVPKDAPWLVKRAMAEIPRRASPLVSELTVSDMAEHPCLMIPRELFLEIGGENELIPRGLDPYLRREIRKAGFKVAVAPALYIHHLPPPTLRKLLRQFYRNGLLAAYVNRFYPEFVFELATTHQDPERERAGFRHRGKRLIRNMVNALLERKPIHFMTQAAYVLGFIRGWLLPRGVWEA